MSQRDPLGYAAAPSNSKTRGTLLGSLITGLLIKLEILHYVYIVIPVKFSRDKRMWKTEPLGG